MVVEIYQGIHIHLLVRLPDASLERIAGSRLQKYEVSSEGLSVELTSFDPWDLHVLF